MPVKVVGKSKALDIINFMPTKNYCTIYLVRHGETDWNIKGLVQGHIDVPLNENGERQAERTAAKLKHVSFDKAFSSDLVRARKTAEIIALEKKIAVETTKALRERPYGRLEGQNWQENTGELRFLWSKFATLTSEEKKKYRLEDVENNEELMARFVPFLREVAVAYAGNTVLVVSHGGIMRAFLIHLGYASEKTMPSGSIENTAYIKLDCDGVDFNVLETEGVNKLND